MITALTTKKAADYMFLYRGLTSVTFFSIFSYQVEVIDRRSATPTSLSNYKPLADDRTENYPPSHPAENLRVSMISLF